MNGNRNWLIAIVAVACVAAGGGYYFGTVHDLSDEPMQVHQVSTSTAAAKATPIYYQDPDGKADYSPTPNKTADGRDYKPVYSETSAAPAQTSQRAPQGKGRLLYYRNPMGLADTSQTPKKDSMGMDYIPVYENEAGADPNIVQVDPARVQMLGVRTETVALRKALARTIKANGTVQFDERSLATVTTKVGGWVEKLNVASTGESVRAGQLLLEIYAPDTVAAEEEYLVVAAMPSGSHGDMVHGDVGLMADAAREHLRALDVPEGEIERLRRSGKASRQMAVLAPANGIITEKDAVLGMHVDPGTPLYKTADISSVWLIAEVQESDLGQIKRGQSAHTRLVAYPDRVFDGLVDFIYPTLAPDTRTARVRIVIPNSDHALRADMYATIEIDAASGATAAPVLAIPNSAIIDNGKSQIVLVARGAGKFEPRVVRLGPSADSFTEVLSGLKEGEQVVTSASFLIDAESNLRAALRSFAPPADSDPAGREKHTP